MTHIWYLTALSLTLVCLAVCDRRWKLAWWADPKTTAKVLVAGVMFYLVWDLVGIGLNVFHTNPRFTIGLNLGTVDLPIEELLLLSVMIYLGLMIHNRRQKS